MTATGTLTLRFHQNSGEKNSTLAPATAPSTDSSAVDKTSD